VEIKALVKRSQFSEVLGNNVSGKKFLSFRFLELFLYYGENKITEIKVLKKIYPKIKKQE